jgi:hypothetical protein
MTAVMRMHVFVVRDGSLFIYERSTNDERSARDRCAELARQGLVSYCSTKLPPRWFY